MTVPSTSSSSNFYSLEQCVKYILSKTSKSVLSTVVIGPHKDLYVNVWPLIFNLQVVNFTTLPTSVPKNQPDVIILDEVQAHNSPRPTFPCSYIIQRTSNHQYTVSDEDYSPTSPRSVSEIS